MAKSRTPRPRVTIKASRPNGAVTAAAVARVFEGLQSVYFIMGEDVMRGKARTSGAIPQSIREAFTLEVTQIELGSVKAEFRLASVQQAKLDQSTPAAQAAQRVDKLLDIVTTPGSRRDELQAVSKDPRVVHRLLQELQRVAPSIEDYRVEAAADSTVYTLDLRAQENIRRLIVRDDDAGADILTGRIIEVSVDKTRSLTIDTAEGRKTLRYAPAAEPAVRAVLGGLASIRVAPPEGKRKHPLLEADQDVARLTTLPIASIPTAEGEKRVKPPIPFVFDTDEDTYIATNRDLGIVAAETSMAALVKNIHEQLAAIWAIYVESSVDALSTDAKELRAHLLHITGGSP